MSQTILCSPPFFMPTFADPVFLRLNGALRRQNERPVQTIDLNQAFMSALSNPEILAGMMEQIEIQIEKMKQIPEYERSKSHRRQFLNLVNGRVMHAALCEQLDRLKEKCTTPALYEAAGFMDAYFSLRYLLEMVSTLFVPVQLSIVDYITTSEIGRLEWEHLKKWCTQYQPVLDECLVTALSGWGGATEIWLCVSYLNQLPFTLRILTLLKEQGFEGRIVLTGSWIDRRLESLKTQDWLTELADLVPLEEWEPNQPDYTDIDPLKYWSPEPVHVILTDYRRPPGAYQEMGLGLPLEAGAIDRWVDEAQRIKQSENISHFYLAGRPLAGSDLQTFTDRLGDTAITWMAEAYLDSSWETVDAPRLFQAGCRLLQLNDLPLNDRRQAFHPTVGNPEQIKAALKNIKEAGIWAHTDLNIGIPGENREAQAKEMLAIEDLQEQIGSLRLYPFHFWADGPLFQHFKNEIKCMKYPGKVQDLLVFIHSQGGLDDYLRAELTLHHEHTIRQWPGSAFLWMIRAPLVYHFLTVCHQGSTAYAEMKPLMPENNPQLSRKHAESIHIKGHFLPQVGLSMLEQLAYTM